jgi:hypothetical protein
MRGISMRENREARRSPVGVDAAPPSWTAGWRVGARVGREGKAVGRKPSMIGRRESDSRVVPAKLANNAGGPAAEPVEERRLDKGNTDQQTVPRTQRRDHGVSSALDRVRRVASRDRDARFTALLYPWGARGRSVVMPRGRSHGSGRRGHHGGGAVRRSAAPPRDSPLIAREPTGRGCGADGGGCGAKRRCPGRDEGAGGR